MSAGKLAVADVLDRRLASTRETELGLDSLDTVGGVDVLDESELPAGCAALAGDDCGVGEEVFPDPEPSLAIFGFNLVAVGHPVSVPAPQSGRVVHADGVDALYFKAGTLELVNYEAERSASVRSREDVLVHEQTPDQIFVLPGLAQSSDLEEENTVIIEHVIHLG